jgi:hypothetical protein
MYRANHFITGLTLLLTCLVITANGIEVRVLTGMVMRGQANLPDHSDQKLVINSNNRYIYPAQQVP